MGLLPEVKEDMGCISVLQISERWGSDRRTLVLQALRLGSRQRKGASIGRREGRTRRFPHCRIQLAEIQAARCDRYEVGAEGAQQLREPRPGIASQESGN